MNSIKRLIFAAVFLSLTGGLLSAQEQPKIQEEVVVRWWLVPVYAMKKDGSPALDLKPEDFEVYLNATKIPFFDLHKKEFQLAAGPKKPPAVGITPSFEKKLVFLVFDSAFSGYALLERAKRVAETMIAREGQAAQFIVLTIEPYSGLRTILGPTRDRDLLARNIDEFVSGKKADYLRSNALDSTSIRNVYPSGSGRNPDELYAPGRWMSVVERQDTAEKKRIAAVYTQSLMTLNLILGYFRDNSKVIYLFSCGIPRSAMDWKRETTIDPSRPAEPGVNTHLNIMPDRFNLEALEDVARYYNRNGSLLFLINPAGTRLDSHDQDSGEQSLRMLAGESGGRYYDGPEEEIAEEIAGMESAYYEISFPDTVDVQGSEIDLEIRPRDSGLDIYTVKRVSRGKEYGQMTRRERQVLVLNLLDRGPYAQAHLRVVDSELQRVSSEGGLFSFSIRLPRALVKSEWDIFMVWRKTDAGKVMMEEARVLSAAADLTVDMKRRKGFRHDLVLINSRTGTTLVFQK
jgi:hypothetical protein